MDERKSNCCPEPEVASLDLRAVTKKFPSLEGAMRGRLNYAAAVAGQREREFEAYVKDHGINAAWVLSSLRRIRCEAKVRK